MKHIMLCVAIILFSTTVSAQESAGQTLAIVDAGHLLPKESAQVAAVETELEKTAKYFKTDTKTASNLIWYHVKAARAKGSQISVIDFMRVARKAVSTKGSLTPSAESLNFFGAYYQASCCNR